MNYMRIGCRELELEAKILNIKLDREKIVQNNKRAIKIRDHIMPVLPMSISDCYGNFSKLTLENCKIHCIDFTSFPHIKEIEIKLDRKLALDQWSTKIKGIGNVKKLMISEISKRSSLSIANKQLTLYRCQISLMMTLISKLLELFEIDTIKFDNCYVLKYKKFEYKSLSELNSRILINYNVIIH